MFNCRSAALVRKIQQAFCVLETEDSPLGIGLPDSNFQQMDEPNTWSRVPIFMSDKDRRKSNHADQGKKNARMREDVKARKEQGEQNAKSSSLHTDRGDMIPKPNPQTEKAQNRPK
jgi:hypothetical protein